MQKENIEELYSNILEDINTLNNLLADYAPQDEQTWDEYLEEAMENLRTAVGLAIDGEDFVELEITLADEDGGDGVEELMPIIIERNTDDAAIRAVCYDKGEVMAVSDFIEEENKELGILPQCVGALRDLADKLERRY